MTCKKIISFILSIIMIIGILPLNISAADNRTMRTVYLHAQGENPPQATTNVSTAYKGETADIYFAVDNPNKGEYDADTNTHKTPQYDMNGYTLKIYFDEEYFDYAGDDTAPIVYNIPDENFDTNDKGNVGDDVTEGEDNTVEDGTTENIPDSVGYFVYRAGSGSYQLGTKVYKTAYITVLYSGGYVPQKRDDQYWYNLAKLPLTPIKTGSTDVFINIDNEENHFALELFAKNEKSDELEDQTFDFNAVNGGHHTIVIKDRVKPATPVVTPGTGSYPESVELTIAAEAGCKIWYTDNGEDPETSAARIPYEGPFTITEDKVIKTCAQRISDGRYSKSVSYEYEILPDRPYLFGEDGEDKVLLADMNSISTKTDVYVSDKNVFGNIADGSEVYYTFSTAELPNDTSVISTDADDAETEWVKVSKQTPVIEIDKNCIIRLVTERLGHISEEAVYYFSIKPLIPEANYDSGEYDEKIDVTLSCETEGATIYYTTDGSDPKTKGIIYDGIPVTLKADTTLRAISFYDGEWSDKVSYYYLFNFYDDYGVDAFYPPGVYEGSVNVTLTPNNPDYTLMYRTDDGVWKEYTEVIVVDENTTIIAKVVKYNDDGSTTEGDEYQFTYKIKPLSPEFAPESTQFTNANKITIYTPESTAENTENYDLYYTLDGTDPITSNTRIHADAASDAAVIDITKYTVVTAAVHKNNESWSTVVKHSYDIVKLKPVKPLTTLLPGYYTHEIGGEGFATQFMPVSQGTKVYYTVCYDGGLCPDPIPDTDGTYLYDGTAFIDIKGNTVIKAVAVNVFGVKSDVGIFSYTVTPQAPKAAPSATIGGDDMPVVPVDAVKGSVVKYTIGGFENEFHNTGAERFYIDTETGMAYRDKECTEMFGAPSSGVNSGSVTLELSSSLDGVESDVSRYTYAITDSNVLAPPYADKETGTYEEIKIDDDNNILKVMLYSLNSGGTIQYRIDNEGEWEDYAEDSGLLFKEDTVLQLRYKKDDNYSAVISYVYNFVPLAPIIKLPSGTYLKSDNINTEIAYSEDIPTDKDYNIFYRRNGDPKDYKYNFSDIEPENLEIDHTMTIKAYVLNETTKRVSKNTIHYYIIESGNAASGSVYVAPPYDTDRISAHLLGNGDYAEGIKLLSPNKTADIHYYYTYTKKSDGQPITTNNAVYEIERPIIPTALMDDITIVAWLEDENGKIEGSDGVFEIDFVHLNIPTTSLEESGKVEFSKGTEYTFINDYPTDENIILYYTLDGSDPTDGDNEKRLAYNGEELKLNSSTTVKAVYFSNGVYGEVGTYKYTVPTTIYSGGGSGGYRGGTTTTIDNTRKYTSDIFGNEHPTHIGYIKGYPDGTVQPEGAVTREEITAVLYRITNHEYEKPFAATGDVFPDVKEGRWSAHDIEYMADKEVINGYPDGEFKPSRKLTRAEFATLILRFANIEKVDVENPFTDLDEAHWAYDEILALTNSGLIAGYPDETYKPENNITRAEVMTVINKLLGRTPLESYVESLHFNPYNDLYEDKWYYIAVLEATITHNYWLNDTGYEYKWEDWK